MLERLQVALAFDVETALDVLEMLRNTLGVRGLFSPSHKLSIIQIVVPSERPSGRSVYCD